uniref:ORF7 protein n=1 Tax=Bat Coronavirus MsGD16 TaxID=3018863 RepID=A0AA49EEI7_9NIDO|nr:ORF7 protein [Bat Coronavirus MsGD16]
MFLRITKTSMSSFHRLMLIWILLVRTNQRSSVNLRKRRRKRPLRNSILQHLCSHHLLCCQMLLLKLSLRWLTRLLMLNLSLLHELSTIDAAVQRHRIVVDKLERAADADWLHVAYTRLSGFHEEIIRLGGDSFAARDDLEKKYHPSTTGSTKIRG